MENFVLKDLGDKSQIPEMSLGKLFMRSLSSFNKNIAVIDTKSDKSLTYEELCQRSKTLAASLRFLGVGKNDNVALVVENSKEFLIAYLAATFLGSPLHLISPKYTIYELKQTLSISEPSVILYTQKTRSNVTEVAKEIDSIKNIICLDFDHSSVFANEFQVEEDIDPEDHVAVLCNTSGTTGVPKVAMITQKMMSLCFAQARKPDFYNGKFGEVVPFVIPFFHVYGLFMMTTSLFAGVTIAPFDGFKLDLFLETIQKHKSEKLFLVPTLINFFAKSPLIQNYDLSSVKVLYWAGSLVPAEDLDCVRKRLNLEKCLPIYGMTETVAIAYPSEYKSGSVGKVFCGHHLKITDLKDGHTLTPLQTGEICVKNNVIKGYVKNPEETKKLFDSEGFLHTGDVGYCDEDGNVYITGRIKEIIKYKSFLVSPIELEEILLKHDKIRDVAVVGRPDPRFGEVAVAFVVKEDGVVVTEDEICDFLAEFVNEEKRLHGGVRFVDGIPRNATGKIVRHQLVERFEK